MNIAQLRPRQFLPFTFQIGYLLQVAGITHATAVTVHGCVNGAGRPVRVPPWMEALSP